MSQDLYATFAAAGVALAGAVVAASFLVEEAPKVPHACGARELDATHMMMTSVACAEMGVDMASVHDSFWTHACHVGDMSRVLREQFSEPAPI